MATSSIRRLPMRVMDSQQSLAQDQNTMPTASCSASPSKVAHTRSPSKIPTLSDIAARLNRDREVSTPASSPMKQILGGSTSNDATRPRLELTGRITASPKPAQQGDRQSPMLPTSPSKMADEQMMPSCLSPKAPPSGACSPTKRILPKGLPSLEEIRDRLSRKGLATSNDDTSPNMECTPSSPTKLAASGLTKSPEISSNLEAKVALSPMVQESNPATSGATSAPSKPTLTLTTTGMVGSQKLTHPLPAPPAKVPTHPLQHGWTLYFDSRSAGPSTPGLPPPSPSLPAPPKPTLSSSSWEANLRTIGAYASVESFLGCFAKLHRPSQLERHSSYHLFKDGIKPMWEDPRNAKGGKWTITFRQRYPALVDRSWLWLVLGLIGEGMDGEDETCGAVCSVRPRGDRISLWVKDMSNVEAVNRIGKKLIALLEIAKEPGILLEFSSHSAKYDDLKQQGLYYSVNNAVQPMARTPTMSTFGAAAGLPNADGAKLAAAHASSNLMATSPTSPNGKGFSHFRGQQQQQQQQSPRSPIAVSPNTSAESQPLGRLAGQPNGNSCPNVGTMLGRSPGNAASTANFGALGQSLAPGIGINTPPSGSVSPSMGAARKDAFQQPMSTASWRSGRSSTSPQGQGSIIAADALGAKAEEGSLSRSVSPLKAD
ncbi:related to CDC33 - translation initiation factor eIF4E [Ustilago sp. UG-2017b]|nr:related to CDC33 - translation initiation factor eIF4E [Ustilago sp. UG-2017b]